MSLLTTPLVAQGRKTTGYLTPTTTRGEHAADRPPGIQDNSFLIEEAYNQERGVVQHISTFFHSHRGGAYGYQFTQEWPLGGVAHQLSYSVAVLRPEESTGPGLGDSRLNYRFQLVGDGDATLAVAPRVTAVLPTGDYKANRGAGALAAEAFLPVSVMLSRQFVAHANVGLTLTPNAKGSGGTRATTQTWTSGGSLIWLARASFNVLVEAIYQRAEIPAGENGPERHTSVLISPGVRWAHNFPSGLQIVPGIAVPVGVGPAAAERSILFYLSFEHPFSRAAKSSGGR